jgi:hypothetical protein
MQWGWNYFPYRSKRLHYQNSGIGNETVSDHFDLLRQLVERPTSRYVASILPPCGRYRMTKRGGAHQRAR